MPRRNRVDPFGDLHAVGSGERLRANDLNQLLNRERLNRGRGLARAEDRIMWQAQLRTLPAGTVIGDASATPQLYCNNMLFKFSFDGWTEPVPATVDTHVSVLTPPTSVTALSNGYRPLLHPSLDKIA